jgi:hypothetical protein
MLFMQPMDLQPSNYNNLTFDKIIKVLLAIFVYWVLSNQI